MLKKQMKLFSPGFTLIEMMIVVVIIGIVAAIVVPKITNLPERARVTRAKTDAKSIAQAVDEYQLEHPQPVTSLTQLIPSLFASVSMLQDPWKNPYLFKQCPNNIFMVYSFGPTGKPGTLLYSNLPDDVAQQCLSAQ